eukprot:NODE_10983_length_208_cov_70.345912_g10368_i0.p2 GENE.NODE_10983_length_208_cov_70.345912_g10368_i0~~NODE_10983_length_208_cov_70.345912_g10368_i0.p2  ORF type:complete len:51 (-),score=30.00 NODE_10983_length_208_cov_70.345912_g10368_i0:56-181(-)
MGEQQIMDGIMVDEETKEMLAGMNMGHLQNLRAQTTQQQRR